MRELYEAGQRVPICLWATDANRETVAQLQRIASQPYVTLRVAAMADAHVAEGVAVGTVFAAAQTIVPGALGGDLGCGVSCTRLSIRAELPLTTLQAAVDALARAIPAGDRVHRGVAVPDALFESPLSTSALMRTRDVLASKHLGTLGGGNHFLELDRDAGGGVWLLVHSGSRGLGAAVAGHHSKAVTSPLGALDAESPAGQAYAADVAWALGFARANRAALAARALSVLREVLDIEIAAEESLDVHHNYVAPEEWEGERVWVHRKGAVHVPAGARALIPGSMATASYVVEGLGNAQAFDSCSHGAGRALSRKEARARIKPAALSAVMRKIAWPAQLARQLVEEAPTAYRDIREVLAAQRDLVKRETRLEPIAVLKG